MSKKLGVCKVCGLELANSAKICPHCGAKNKKPILSKWWFWLLIVMFIGLVAGAGGEGEADPNTTDKQDGTRTTVATAASVFAGDCGISADAEIGNNILNLPELTITITNTTDKEIAAIQFYAVPIDVYGEEIKGWTTQSKLYTDSPIEAGKTTTISFQFIEQSVKTVQLYVYSVYFADGTEWGNRDATTSKILNEAPTIEVSVKAGS